MPRKNSTYLFGRLHVIANFEHKPKQKYLQDSINSETTWREGDFEWGFFDYENFEFQKEIYAFGNLTKYKPIADDGFVDRGKHKIVKRQVPDKIYATSSFILHFATGIIAYHPIANKISNTQFKKLFCRIIEEANDQLLVKASIESIDDETAIFEAIRSFEKIHYISIELHPSNPSNRDRWKRTDERLQKLKVDKFKEYYESIDGINLEEDDETFGNVIMAADGYGRAEIVGILDGDDRKVSTEKLAVQGKAPSEGSPLEIFSALLGKFDGIRKRMKN